MSDILTAEGYEQTKEKLRPGNHAMTLNLATLLVETARRLPQHTALLDHRYS